MHRKRGMQIIVPNTLLRMTFREIILKTVFLGIVKDFREEGVGVVYHGGEGA